MPVCELFPAPKVADASVTTSPVQSGEEEWKDIDKQKSAGFSLLFSLTKAVKAISGAEIGAGWQRVKSTEIEWGPIVTKTLVLRDLRQASAASQGQGIYAGRYDGSCFNEARALLAAKQDAYIVGRVAQAASLTANVELNPEAPQAGNAAATKSENEGEQPKTGGAVRKIADATGEVAKAKHAAQDVPDKEGPTGEAPKLDGGGPKDTQAKEAAPKPQGPGTSGNFEVNLMDALKIRGSATVKQTGTTELTFTKPMNVGHTLLSLKELRRAGLMTAPQYTIEFAELGPSEFSSSEGAVSAEQYSAIRRRLGKTP